MSFAYGRWPTTVRALTDVSLQVNEGESLAVIGPSGCGKSTLLSLIGRVLPAPSGTIRLYGEAMAESDAALARALVNQPRVILADEPTGALDSANGEKVFAILRRQADSGRSVVVATHNLDLAGACDRIVALSDGRVVGPDGTGRRENAVMSGEDGVGTVGTSLPAGDGGPGGPPGGRTS